MPWETRARWSLAHPLIGTGLFLQRRLPTRRFSIFRGILLCRRRGLFGFECFDIEGFLDVRVRYLLRLLLRLLVLEGRSSGCGLASFSSGFMLGAFRPRHS